MDQGFVEQDSRERVVAFCGIISVWALIKGLHYKMATCTNLYSNRITYFVTQNVVKANIAEETTKIIDQIFLQTILSMGRYSFRSFNQTIHKTDSNIKSKNYVNLLKTVYQTKPRVNKEKVEMMLKKLFL